MNLTEQDKEDYPKLAGQTVCVTPLTRGELKKIFGIDGMKATIAPDTTKDDDAEIILEHCKNPAFTKEELAHAKPVIVRSIVRTIFAESGIKLDSSVGTKKIEETEDEFGKNSEGLESKAKKGV